MVFQFRLFRRLFVCILCCTLIACGSAEKQPEVTQKAEAWSVYKVVETQQSMLTLFDPGDLAHHQNEPAGWYLRDFAIADDLQSGRFIGVLTERSGAFNVKLSFGELNAKEKAAAGSEVKMRLRVRNGRLLLAGGDAWPYRGNDYRKFVYDQRWIDFPNGDYGVIITALNPAAGLGDYVFQFFQLDDMTIVKHAPAMPQLIYGHKASVVGVNAAGYEYHEQCGDVPGKAQWVPLASRSMPTPGKIQTVELPRSLHLWAMEKQQKGERVSVPLVMSRDPEAGSFGFYIKADQWSRDNVKGQGQAHINTLIRCAVQIVEVVPEPNSFKLRIKAIPTASDRLSPGKKKQLLDTYHAWITANNDPAWRYREAQAKSSSTDAALILGILEHLSLSSKESEKLLPMSNALRVDYLIDRISRAR